MSDYLFTSTEPVKDIIKLMEELILPKTQKPLEWLRRVIDNSIIPKGTEALQLNVVNQYWYLTLGSVILDYLKKLDRSFDTNTFSKFLLEKHRKYGAQSLTRWRDFSIIIRLSSKLDRLVNMLEKDITPQDESIMDTLQDMLGYCVLGYLHRKECVSLT